MSLQELINLVRGGGVESVRSFLSSHDIDLNQVKRSSTQRGRMTETTPLIVACVRGDLKMIQLLLQEGAKVDFQANEGNEGWSALKRAFVDGRVEVVKLLIENGALAADLKVNGENPLCISCKKGDLGMVKALLAKGVRIDSSGFPKHSARGTHYYHWKYSYVACPVNIAVCFGHVQLVKWLLEEGAEVPYGALFLAITLKQRSDVMIEILQHHGADVAIYLEKDGHWSCPMQASGVSDNMFEILLEHGADVNMKGDGGWSVLMQASLFGHSGMVDMLLKKGADVNLQSEGKEFALALAAERAHVEVVQL